jgi:molecular chaperone DnaK
MAVFGIDFGTTNSAAVKLIRGAEPEKYGDEHGRPLPSIVAIDIANGEMHGGRDVWENREAYLESGRFRLVKSVKWKLGTDAVWQTEAGVITPEQVASFVLKTLSRRALEVGGESIKEAAVTIPYGFSPEARASLRNAARQAGIEISTFITESTSALMRYLPDLKHCRNVAVFDWGGGTLDISVLQIRNGSVHELATGGMDLAGDYIDADLAQVLHSIIMDERGASSEFAAMSARNRDSLLTQCERAKCRFEQLQETDVALTSYGGAPAVLRGRKREWFEKIISTHVDLAIELLDKTIQKAGLSADSINRTLVIGGSAKLRLLHERLRNDDRFQSALHFATDAEWDVATGAAIVQASSGGYELAESIGFVLSDNSYYEVLSPGWRVKPERDVMTVSLVEDSRQANIVVARRQSEAAGAETILRFSIPTLGFDLEPLTLRYGVSSDLIFTIEGDSGSFGPLSRTSRTFGELRFAYHI